MSTSSTHTYISKGFETQTTQETIENDSTGKTEDAILPHASEEKQTSKCTTTTNNMPIPPNNLPQQKEARMKEIKFYTVKDIAHVKYYWFHGAFCHP